MVEWYTQRLRKPFPVLDSRFKSGLDHSQSKFKRGAITMSKELSGLAESIAKLAEEDDPNT